jgi:UDP-galactopyranose mutase
MLLHCMEHNYSQAQHTYTRVERHKQVDPDKAHMEAFCLNKCSRTYGQIETVKNKKRADAYMA